MSKVASGGRTSPGGLPTNPKVRSGNPSGASNSPAKPDVGPGPQGMNRPKR